MALKVSVIIPALNAAAFVGGAIQSALAQSLTDLEVLVAEAEARGLDALADTLQLVDFATRAPLGLAFPDAWMTTGETLTLETLLDKDTPGAHDFRPLGFIKPILRRDRLQQFNVQYAEDIAFAEDFCFMRNSFQLDFA
jgi:hypothetical protein